MAVLFFIPALVLAYLALRGWPVGWGMEGRAAIALAALGAGFFALSRLAPAAPYSRFRNTRSPHLADRVTGILAGGLALAILYAFLSLTPRTAWRISDSLLNPRVADASEVAGDEAVGTAGDAEMDGMPLDAAAQTRIGTVYDEEGAAVPDSVNLGPSAKPEVRLEFADAADARRLHQAGRTYVSSFTHNIFDGSRWISRRSSRSQIMKSDAEGAIHLAESWGKPPAYRYTVMHGHLPNGMNTVTALQGAQSVRLPEIILTTPGTYLLTSLKQGAINYEYEAASTPRNFESLLADQVPLEAGETEPIYLAPTSHDSLRRQIQDLATRFKPDQPLAQRLTRLRDWLMRSYTYSPTVRYPANGRSVLENFLGEPGVPVGAGICIHFASAAALLAREFAVPSRVCYGWAGGRYYDSHRQFVFQGDHAHAWAEIYLKDHGWVIFEVTPAAGVPVQMTTAPGELPPTLSEYLEEEEDMPLGDEFVIAAPYPHWGWAVAAGGLAMLALVILSALKLRGTRRPAGSPIFAEAPPAPGYFKMFHEACARLGQPMPNGTTLLQHLHALRGRDIPVALADDLLAYHYGITYRNLPRDSQAEKLLCLQIKAWSAGA